MLAGQITFIVSLALSGVYAQTGQFCLLPQGFQTQYLRPGPDLPNERYSFGSVVSFSCPPGLTLVGSTTARCANRQWLLLSVEGAPECIRGDTTVPSTTVDACGGRCPANSNCTPTGGVAACTCRRGYTQVGNTCQLTAGPTVGPVDQCRGGCPANSDCTPIDGQPACTCRSGYSQVNRLCVATATPVITPSVVVPTGRPICPGGCPVRNTECAFLRRRARCICQVGYIEVGMSCQTRDLVRANPGQCSPACPPNSACSLFDRQQIVCVCNPGYILYEGTSCIPRPSTIVSQTPVLPSISPGPICPSACPSTNSICVVLLGSPRCICQVGYIAVGRSCQSRALVQAAPGQCTSGCPANSACSIFDGQQIVCVCNPGFVLLDGTSCVLRPGAVVTTPRPVLPTATVGPICPSGCPADKSFCVLLLGTPSCICQVNYIEVGRSCQSRALAQATPGRCPVDCPANSACSRFSGRSVCICNRGYVLYKDTSCVPRPTATPTITIRTCARPAESNFRYTIPNRNQRTWAVGELIFYGCEAGYVVQGSRSARCLPSGLFTNPPPTCTVVVTPTPRTTIVTPTPTPSVRCLVPRPPTGGRTLPPGRTVFLVGQLVTFACDSPLILSGPPTATCLSSGQFSPGRPVCVPATTVGLPCPVPFAPPNGDYNPKSTGYRPTDVVTYTCNSGYVLLGQARATCQSSGTYSSQPPRCEVAATCSPPYLAPGAIINRPQNTVYTSGTTVTFTCTAGTLFGRATISCGSDGSWSDPFPTCGLDGTTFRTTTITVTPRVTCSNPPVPSGGFINSARPSGVWFAGETVFFACTPPGFLVADRSSTCQPNGRFTPAVSACVVPPTRTVAPTTNTPTTCPRPAPPINGAILGSQQTWNVGENLIYICNLPFVAEGGSSLVTCGSGGTFSGTPPTCEMSTLPECRRPNPPENGEILGDANRQTWSQGELLLYNCFSGFNLVGNENVVCGEDGNFNAPAPQCIGVVATAPEVTCPPPTPPINGGIVEPKSSYTVGEQIAFVCQNGFMHSGSRALRCGEDGKFSGLVPSCTVIPPTTCSAPTAPENGVIANLQESYNVGDDVVFVCQDGFQLAANSSAILECLSSGEFDRPVPTCTAVAPTFDVVCAPPDIPTNGVISNPQIIYRVGETVMFACAEGFVADGNAEIECLETGFYSGEPLACRAPSTPSPVTSCPSPTAPASGSILNPSTSYAVGDAVIFACNAGARLVGLAVTICGTDGALSSSPPTCEFPEPTSTTPVSVNCPSPAAPASGSILNPSSSYTVDDIVIFACNSGNQLVGSPTTTCRSDGTFSSPTPLCERTPPPPTPSTAPLARCAVSAPVNGLVVGGATSVAVGQQVVYQCDVSIANIRLLGQSSSLCQNGGVLSSPVPVCTVCNPTPPENGFIFPRDKTSWRATELIEYRCNPGYNLDGRETSLCGPRGNIFGDRPRCTTDTIVVTTCRPTQPANGYTLPRGQLEYPDRRTFEYACEAGYRLMGSAMSVCIDGLQQVDPPECTRI